MAYGIRSAFLAQVSCKVYLRELQEVTNLTDKALQHVARVAGPRRAPPPPPPPPRPAPAYTLHHPATSHFTLGCGAHAPLCYYVGR